MVDRTEIILDFFEQINAIPRCSKNEARICQWLRNWAAERNLDYEHDEAGNLVMRVPASAGYEHGPVVVLQGHMDMVCEKTPASKHDFAQDPIVSHKEGDWLAADDTTLGADNGIALAYMLALAQDPCVDHPALELLFTVDEETGLTGAKLLKPDFVKGGILINLDSEDEGIFTIGCAGGVDTTLSLNIQREKVPGNAVLYQIVVGGLKGGHSGIDIDKHRGNANKVMARTLDHVMSATVMGLVSLSGGSRKNAIARDARSLFWAPAGKEDLIRQAVSQITAVIKAELQSSDANLFVELSRPSGDKQIPLTLNSADTRRAIQMLLALPHGVARMSSTLPGLVETSSNLATMDLSQDRFTIVSSQRSASASRLDEITATVTAIGRLSGADVTDSDDYPPWQPDLDCTVLSLSKEVYQRLFAREPVIQVIHAGLECAIIGDIYPGMEMISFGPTLRNPHSPDEQLYIPSIIKVWCFLTELLKAMK